MNPTLVSYGSIPGTILLPADARRGDKENTSARNDRGIGYCRMGSKHNAMEERGDGYDRLCEADPGPRNTTGEV